MSKHFFLLIYHLPLSPLQHVVKFIKNSKDQHVSQPAQETLDKHLCRWFRFAQLAKGKKFRP